MHITWTCDPPEFAAYVNRVTATDRGDFVLIDLGMRCKRVPTNAAERTVWDEAAQEYAHSGHLDITFAAAAHKYGAEHGWTAQEKT